MERLTFILLVCMSFASSYSTPLVKYLHVAMEAVGSGTVYMTYDPIYWGRTEYIDRKSSKDFVPYFDYYYGFNAYDAEDGSDVDSVCSVYFLTKANPGYGLLGFSETKKDVKSYEENDFVLDVNGKKAKDGSLIDVNDPNTPWMVADGRDRENLEWYSKEPNRHYYAVFTEIPDFAINDGVDMKTAVKSPTETYTVTYKRHLSKGWNAVFLPFAFDVELYKSMIEGADVRKVYTFDTFGNLACGIVGRRVAARTPLLLYSPIEYDLEYVCADRTITYDDSEIMGDMREGPKGKIAGAFSNKTVDGKCYKLTFDGKKSVFIESDNNVLAFQFVIVYENESSAPLSKKIELSFPEDNPNGINMIESAPSFTGEGIYTLDGRRLNVEPTHGIFIKNGKKFAR